MRKVAEVLAFAFVLLTATYTATACDVARHGGFNYHHPRVVGK